MSEGWTWVTWVVALLVGVVTTWIFARRERATRHLDYRVVTQVPLVSRSIHVVDSMKVLHNDRMVADPHMVVIEFRNTGSRAIMAGEYARPIKIDYSGGEPIETMVVVITPAVDIDTFEADIESDSIIVKPDLLNRGEAFGVMIASDGPLGDITASCRIVDESRPMRRFERRELDYTRVMYLGLLLNLLFMGIVIPAMFGIKLTLEEIVVVSLIAGGLTLLSYLMSDRGELVAERLARRILHMRRRRVVAPRGK